MAIWAAPQTNKQAERLEYLMLSALSPNKAKHELYDLVGSDRLFEQLDEHSESYDVRWLVAYHVKLMLEERETFIKPWQKKALSICKRIVNQYY